MGRIRYLICDGTVEWDLPIRRQTVLRQEAPVKVVTTDGRDQAGPMR